MSDQAIKQVVADIRIATDRQGKSGLGIEAQHAAIARFVAAERCALLLPHAEVETGKRCDALDRRPQLATALAAART